MYVGTITNIITVLVGTGLGALLGSRFPTRMRETVLATLGLLTLALAIRETLPTEEFVLVLAAVLIGAVLGEVMKIEQGLEALGHRIQRRVGGQPSVELDASVPERSVPRPHDVSFADGFVIASLVFCIGPLTVVGSIQDGLGEPELLLVKAGLDGFASIAFASVYGWGVGLAALTVAVVQGGIALAAGAIESSLTDPMIDALGAAGGILLLGVALRLLEVKRIRVANLLPAIVLAPLFVRWWA